MRIQFEADRKLRRKINHRTEWNGKVGLTARRDLGRYYDLLECERRTIALTKDEAELVCLAVGGCDLDLSSVVALSAWVEDYADVMGEELKSHTGEELKVDFRKLRPKLCRLSNSQILAVLDAADSYMLDRRLIPSGKNEIEKSGLVRPGRSQKR
jgi:hypothetical protein